MKNLLVMQEIVRVQIMPIFLPTQNIRHTKFDITLLSLYCNSDRYFKNNAFIWWQILNAQSSLWMKNEKDVSKNEIRIRIKNHFDLSEHFMQISFSLIISCLMLTMYNHLIFCLCLCQIPFGLLTNFNS